MEKITCRLLALLLAMTFGAGLGAAQNKLSLPDVKAQAGRTAQLPVMLDNTAEIVGFQFDIALPQGIYATGVATTDRSASHQIQIANVSGTTRVLGLSTDNSAMRGNSGTLFYIEAYLPDGFAEGDYQLALSDVTLTDKTGANVMTGYSAGMLSVVKAPDLETSAVTTDKSQAMPGDIISVSWQVANVGGMPTTGGWKEQISLISADGLESKQIATVYYDGGNLAASGTASRQAQIELPQIIGLDGNATVQVKVVANSDAGEPATAQANNTAVSANPINIGRQLYIELPTASVDENYGLPLSCKLTRSGSRQADEVFNLTLAEGDSRLAVPASVTIPSGYASANFLISVVDNSELDDSDAFTIEASGNAYEVAQAAFTVIDDEYPALSITPSASAVTEGESLTLTITAQRAPKADAIVNLYCDLPRRFTYPSSVALPAGATTVTVEISTVDNDDVEEDATAVFTAQAEGFEDGYCAVEIADDDMPEITLQLTPDAVSESAGPNAVVAVLKRTTNINKQATIKITDNSEGRIYYQTDMITMASGVEQAQFSIGIVDNAIVDEVSDVEIQAAVYIASCSCSAPNTSGGTVKATLTILDNDGPAVELKAQNGTWLEGSEGNVLTVSRNTSADRALTVSLSSNADSRVEYPSQVTIPVGETSVQALVNVLKNDTSDDTETIVFTAEATDYTMGKCWVMITDQSLPDGIVSAISLSASEGCASETVTAKITVENIGFAPLAEATKIGFYFAGQTVAAATAYLPQDVAEGTTLEIEQEITLPSTVGAANLYAVVNDGQKAKEINYTNNVSAYAPVTVVSPYSLSVAVDKAEVKAGESVNISGKVTGKDVKQKDVEIYIVNNGVRQTLSAKSDDNGDFSAEFAPLTGQVGRFDVGACYPGENLTDSEAYFKLYGLKRATTGYIKCEMVTAKPYVCEIPLTNPCDIAMYNVTATVAGAPDDMQVTVEPIGTMQSEGKADLRITLTGSKQSDEVKWYPLDVTVTTDYGQALTTTVYYYVRNAEPTLKTSVSTINTTMTVGESRAYPFQITNTGDGATGKITLSLPSWMKSATPLEINSLAKNDTAQVVLMLEPTSSMNINVPVTGTIALNSESGKGMSIPYSIVPVSETTGWLHVDVCDEYTYFTAEAPHVEGAKVIVRSTYNNTVVAQGETDATGCYDVELPEGYYALSVSAQNHDCYSNNILIDPAQTRSINVNLSYQAISYTWDVVETEVEDEYRIVTTVTFETNVPAPVVLIEGPDEIEFDDMVDGESRLYYFTLTNKGLITAFETQFILPDENENWKFEFVDEQRLIDIPANQTVVYPVLFTRKGLSDSGSATKIVRRASDATRTYNNCMANMNERHKTLCPGQDLKDNSTAAGFAVGTCMLGTIASSIGGGAGGGGGLGGPGGGGGGSGTYGPSSSQSTPTSSDNDYCDPCRAHAAKKWVDCIIGFDPIWGCPKGIADCATGGFNARNAAGCGLTAVSCVASVCAAAAGATGAGAAIAAGCVVIDKVAIIGSCLLNFTEPCPEDSTKNPMDYMRVRRAKSDNISTFHERAAIPLQEITAYGDFLKEILGSDGWGEVTAQEMSDVFEVISDSDKEQFSLEDFADVKPMSVSTVDMATFVERFNNSFLRDQGKQPTNDNYIDYDKLAEYVELIQDAENQSIALGYESTEEMWNEQYEIMEPLLSEGSKSVCSSVTVQFSQTMVVTRQAFRGTLTVYNGNESTAMTDVKLLISITDPNGAVATSREFQINAESLDGFTGQLDLEAGWSLAAQSTGTATVLFIPTKYAAPELPMEYSFGGILSYIDPSTGLEVRRDLSPVTLTVKPSPVLDLTYFMQRDVFGDDPLTEAIEPMQEAEFSLLINNVGNGDATRVQIYTEQPKIVDNEKGLLIDFEIISAQLNGQDKTLALGGTVATDFGEIPSKSTAYAQWWFTSTLLGHFNSYNVEATHVTSYGNPDLSLLGDVTIHELIRSLKLGTTDDALAGFLVNDIEDANDYPDRLYLSDGSVEDVAIAKSAEIASGDGECYLLAVTPSSAGWNYGAIVDPTAGRQVLASITRQSDGQQINLRNFWQTDRTLPDGKEPIYENLIHFADLMEGGADTYLLTFEPRPEVTLEVAAINGVPDEGVVLKEPLAEVTVEFNKAIDPTTFSADDITLHCQGEKLDASLVAINQLSDQQYSLDLSNVNSGDGYYTLAVQTAGIVDTEGFTGTSGRQASWIQYADGKVTLSVVASPTKGGTVTPASGRYDYGAEVALKAVPAEGYEFTGWSRDGETVSTEPEYNATLLGDALYTAGFAAKRYRVDVNYPEGAATLTGAATGVYEYGDELTIGIEPAAGYRWVGWRVDGKIYSRDRVITITVDGDFAVDADLRSTENYVLGDANADTQITVADAVALARYLDEYEVDEFDEVAADADENDSLDGEDIFAILDLAAKWKRLTAPLTWGGPIAALDIANLAIEPAEKAVLKVNIVDGSGYAAMQADLELPDGLTISDVYAGDDVPESTYLIWRRNSLNRMILYSAIEDALTIGTVFEVVIEADADFVPQMQEITLTNGIVVTIDGSDIISYSTDDANAIVTDTQGIASVVNSDFRLWLSDGVLHIVAPCSAQAILSDIAGRSTVLNVESGHNTYPIGGKGLYIVSLNGHVTKLIVK
ncbi:MAG: hypothetical protein LIP03_03985 [Bacteroidales bacterium]|nr:hypothetical protein [Bacteroidales bacterium]